MSDDGLVVIYTGKGKGKTTAALGMALRALGHGFKIVMVQFIKGEWFYGELSSSSMLEPDFELVAAGKGFVGIIDDDKPIEDHVVAAKKALQISKEKIISMKYDIVILDEINYAVYLKLISTDDVLELIKIKPKDMTLVLTGNYASAEVIESADLVTEMREIKHPYKQGKKAKKGVDF
ncbi:MAG: cob(I)yrinic acid a,c-diamide adenosyltransferase [Thaumarchaeota archaeon]|nr:cob(I)yrinic acid a,c-diamide adenosyltransferase [Nitrososphaerota archaeon]